jgi:hypothetical protein
MKKPSKTGKIIEAKDLFRYIIISIVLIFIVFYIIDGLDELFHPLKSFSFPYKSLLFYFLKLAYAILLIIGAFDLCKQRLYCWSIFQFASIGILTSSLLFYFGGYIFRSSILDLFILEFLSLVLLFVINTKKVALVIEIKKPTNWLIFTFFFMFINLILNISFWYLSGLQS